MTGPAVPTIVDLTRRLAEAEATIRALLTGQIDSSVDVTHQTPVLLANAHESLRQSEERYRHIVDGTNEGVWLIDSAHETTFMNRRMAEMLRCDADLELGQSPEKFIDEVGRDALLRHRDNPAIHQSEIQFTRTDGTAFWAHVEGVPMFDSAGGYEGSLAMVRDVTERHAAEIALRKTTADLVERTNVLEVQAALLKEQAALLDLPADAIVVRDLNNCILFWNRGAHAMYGWASEEALGRSMERLVKTACLEPFEVIRDMLLATGHWEGEGTHERRDGTPIDVASRWTLQRDAAGEALRVLSISHDVTARRRSEIERRRLTSELETQAAALRENESRTTYALGASRMGVWELDLRTRRVTWSETMPAVHGLAADQCPSTAAEFLEVIHPDDRAMMEAALDHAVLTRTEFEAEFRSVWPDGTTHWNAGRAHVVCDEQGEPVRVLGVTAEISDRKSLEAQFQQSQKMEAVGQLAGGVAHDFNNLLTVVLGYSGFVMETFGPNDPRRGDMDEILKAGERATAVTRQLLAFSRKQVLQPTNVDLNALVLGMQEMLGRLIGENIAIGHRLARDLGTIRADAGQLEQVLMNLAVNARDAMPAGGRLSFITMAVDIDRPLADTLGIAAGPYVLLAVTDDGAGMTESVRRRLFEPFFTTKEPGKGTGLGLATVYGIVKQTGGTVCVVSAPGEGATFQVYLPRGQDTADVAPRGALSMRPDERGQETVLVVEDEHGVRLLTRRILEKAGYRVLDAPGGDQAEAVLAAHQGAVDLLVTDVIMPGMSGPTLFERLVQQRPGLKVLYVSGYTADAIAHQGRLDPGVEFLQKPFTTASLNRRVRDVLEGRSSGGPASRSTPRQTPGPDTH